MWLRPLEYVYLGWVVWCSPPGSPPPGEAPDQPAGSHARSWELVHCPSPRTARRTADPQLFSPGSPPQSPGTGWDAWKQINISYWLILRTFAIRNAPKILSLVCFYVSHWLPLGMRRKELILKFKQLASWWRRGKESINLALGKFMCVLHAHSPDCNVKPGSLAETVCQRRFSGFSTAC